MPNQQVLSDKIIFLNRSDEGRRPTKQSMCGGCKEKVLLAPLYYPDILVNPDTCQVSKRCKVLFRVFATMVTLSCHMYFLLEKAGRR